MYIQGSMVVPLKEQIVWLSASWLLDKHSISISEFNEQSNASEPTVEVKQMLKVL